jgi:transcriptional regulator with XRE-family HTH domain
MKERLGYNIRKIREIKNISQDFMAKYLNISQAAYSRLENGITKIDDNKLARVAAALSVETEAIRNFNEQLVLNVSAPATGLPEKIKEVYEKLLLEKEAQIRILAEIMKKA